MSETKAIYLTLTHSGGSSRPCEVVAVENKNVGRSKTATATAIRVRFGVAGVYEVNPFTGSVKNLDGAWTAQPTECSKAIQAWDKRTGE